MIATEKDAAVFALRKIASGETIEEAPVVTVPEDEVAHLDATGARRLLLPLGRRRKTGARSCWALLALQSFLRSRMPASSLHPERHTIEFIALRDIAEGEEVTTNYNGNPESREAGLVRDPGD